RGWCIGDGRRLRARGGGRRRMPGQTGVQFPGDDCQISRLAPEPVQQRGCKPGRRRTVVLVVELDLDCAVCEKVKAHRFTCIAAQEAAAVQLSNADRSHFELYVSQCPHRALMTRENVETVSE